jgi:hypothetical protein
LIKYPDMNNLIYSILKELFEGKKVNADQISNFIDQEQGNTNKSNMNAAWNYIITEGLLKPIDPSEHQGGLALQIISDHGKKVYQAENKRREESNQEAQEAQRLKSLASQNLWYTTQNAKDVFDDYPIIKKNQKITIWVSVISALIAFVAFIVAILKK